MREWTPTMRQPQDKIENGFVYQGIIDKGSKYIDEQTGEAKDFIGEDGRKYLGLLNGRGGALKHGEAPHIIWFAMRSADQENSDY